jgi:hypothetical protein
MKWSPADFWASTPYDCLLAAGGMAKIHGDKKNGNKLSKSEIAELVAVVEKEKLKNGQG